MAVFKRMEQRRAERKAAYPHEDEPEVAVKTTPKEHAKMQAAATQKGYSLEKHEEAIAKAEADAKAKKDAEPVPLTPSPEPPVLPKWQPTVAPKIEDNEKTVGDWIIAGITKIVDEHKLTSLTAWRDVSGNVVVQYVEDPRAMYALRKA